MIESSPTIKVKSYSPELAQESTLEELSLPVVEKPKEIPDNDSGVPFKNYDTIVNKPMGFVDDEQSLVGKQVCQDNVNVTYTLMDQSGVNGTYPAILQAQGVIKKISQNKERIKIKTTGWYSQSDNLNKWAPYLKNPPLAKGILLKSGAEFWGELSEWYLCGGGEM